MVDTIQARYGWSDEYVFNSLPAERAFMIFEVVNSQLDEEKKERLREQAFNAWLRGSELPFDRYIAQLNLAYVDPDDLALANEVTADEAFDIARNILSRFRPEEGGKTQ